MYSSMYSYAPMPFSKVLSRPYRIICLLEKHNNRSLTSEMSILHGFITRPISHNSLTWLHTKVLAGQIEQFRWTTEHRCIVREGWNMVRGLPTRLGYRWKRFRQFHLRYSCPDVGSAGAWSRPLCERCWTSPAGRWTGSEGSLVPSP